MSSQKSLRDLMKIDLDKASKRIRKNLSKIGKIIDGGEETKKLLRKRVVEKSGKKCHCGGHIVKVKFWELPAVHFNGIYGPGSRVGPRNPIEKFTPLHCENCGIQYFELPITKKTIAITEF